MGMQIYIHENSKVNTGGTVVRSAFQSATHQIHNLVVRSLNIWSLCEASTRPTESARIRQVQCSEDFLCTAGIADNHPKKRKRITLNRPVSSLTVDVPHQHVHVRRVAPGRHRDRLPKRLTPGQSRHQPQKRTSPQTSSPHSLVHVSPIHSQDAHSRPDVDN